MGTSLMKFPMTSCEARWWMGPDPSFHAIQNHMRWCRDPECAAEFGYITNDYAIAGLKAIVSDLNPSVPT